MTDREKHLLWMMMQIHCYRYIMANSGLHPDGTMKAREHVIISKLIAHYILSDGGLWTIRGIDEEWPKGWDEIHDWTEKYITDILDVSIGLPVGKAFTAEETNIYARKLFDKLCEYMPVLEIIAADSQEESTGLYNG